LTSTVGGAQPVSWRASGAALRVVLCHAPLFPTSCQQHAGLVASQWPICQDKLRTGSERGQKLDGAKIDSRERESPALRCSARAMHRLSLASETAARRRGCPEPPRLCRGNRARVQQLGWHIGPQPWTSSFRSARRRRSTRATLPSWSTSRRFATTCSAGAARRSSATWACCIASVSLPRSWPVAASPACRRRR
jgi:hypothetical protein